MWIEPTEPQSKTHQWCCVALVVAAWLLCETGRVYLCSHSWTPAEINRSEGNGHSGSGPRDVQPSVLYLTVAAEAAV